MTIDYEKEYDNRARVPEHPAIFARWARDAETFRAEMTRAGRAELGVKYGPGERHVIDLFYPERRDGAPLAVFIHGGWWRSLEPASFSHLARGMNAHGVTVALPGYDLCPQVRMPDIIPQMRQACLALWRRFGQRMLVSGHSAGGHLAACMAATDWRAEAPDSPNDLVPAVYTISGVHDVTHLLKIAMNKDLQIREDEVRAVSPLYWPVPDGCVLDAVVGALESSEFLRMSEAIAQSWRQGGAITRYEAVPGANHFTVIDPLSDPDSAMTARHVELARHSQSWERA
jgi:arylformamidase